MAPVAPVPALGREGGERESEREGGIDGWWEGWMEGVHHFKVNPLGTYSGFALLQY